MIKLNNYTLLAGLGLMLGFILLPTIQVLAQGGPGNGGPTPTNIPIDGGASLLVAGGVALGVKKLRNMRRK
jgi:hypothetical protein